MVVVNNILKDLKAELYDLTLPTEKISRKGLMEKLGSAVNNLLGSEQVSTFMCDTWKMNDRLEIYHSGEMNDPMQRIAMEALENFDTSSTDGNITKTIGEYHVITLNCHVYYYGVMVIERPNYLNAEEKLLENIGELILRFLKANYAHSRKLLLQKRRQLFFELSTELHAVHETSEVINSMYATINKFYPYFEFSLLMTQDYDCETVPIKLIEYSSEMVQSSGTMAFIDNEIKIDRLYEQGKMHVFSPLAGKQGVYGVVQITIPQIIHTSALEWDFILQFSSMTGMAIERTTLFQSSNKQVSNLQMINNASHELNLKLERSDIIDIVKKYTMKTSEADEFAVVIFDEAPEKNKTDYLYEVLQGSTSFFFTDAGFNLLDYLSKKLTAERDSILSGNFSTNYKECPYQSMMAIPMWSTGSIFGFIVMAHKTPYYFTFDKFKFIQSFIHHASLAFINSLLKEQLHEMATTDYLTKLYARNYLDEKVIEHMDSAHSGSFALFDIDDFKQVNDTYGHYVGDTVLVETAKVIERKIATTDIIAARWGGEEFALYFPSMTIDEAAEKVNEIRDGVFQATDPKITLSCGMTAWKKDGNINTIKKLFISADEALYEAKLSGKNQTVKKRNH